MLRRISVATSVAGFLLALAVAAVRLPAQVDVYIAPATSADVVYPRWYFLVGVAALGLLQAWGVRVATSFFVVLGKSFGGGIDDRLAPALAGSWALLGAALVAWVAAEIGNSDPLLRSTLETVAVSVGAGGGLAIGLVVVVLQVRRGERGARTVT